MIIKPDILIIDDEQTILQSLLTLFGSEGIIVDTENHPVKAIERYKNNHYNVVLVDIVMPQMKGPQVVKAIKSLNPLCNVIMMTAYSNMENVIDCIEAGAVDYITKPFVDADLLIATVKEALKRVDRWRHSFGLHAKIVGGEK